MQKVWNNIKGFIKVIFLLLVACFAGGRLLVNTSKKKQGNDFRKITNKSILILNKDNTKTPVILPKGMVVDDVAAVYETGVKKYEVKINHVAVNRHIVG